jgi:hypothetical protein
MADKEKSPRGLSGNPIKHCDICGDELHDFFRTYVINIQGNQLFIYGYCSNECLLKSYIDKEYYGRVKDD